MSTVSTENTAIMALSSQMFFGLRTMCSVTEEPKPVVSTIFYSRATVTKKESSSLSSKPMFCSSSLIRLGLLSMEKGGNPLTGPLQSRRHKAQQNKSGKGSSHLRQSYVDL